jgi:hypothetical protein
MLVLVGDITLSRDDPHRLIMAAIGGGASENTRQEECGDTAKWGWSLVRGVGSLAPPLLGWRLGPSPDAWSPRMLRLAPRCRRINALT